MTTLSAPAGILIVGDIMLDRYWFGEVNRISPEAPVPVVRVIRCEERLGGAANVAHNVVALGAAAGLLGTIGQDEAGATVETLLAASHIQSYIHIDQAMATVIKLRVIGRQQQLVRIDFEAAPTELTLRNKLTQFNQLAKHHHIIIFSDYAKGSLVNIVEMIDIAKKLGKPILVDPKGDDFARYKGAFILTPNKAELRSVVGSWNNEQELTKKAQSLRRLLELEALLLTRSGEGMTLYLENQEVHFPGTAKEVYDVSGAGDTVIATLAVQLSLGKSLVEAVNMANRAGSIVVSKLGAATVSLEELAHE